MRFGAVVNAKHKQQQLQPPQRVLGAELIRRLLKGEPQGGTQPARPQELPADLDQRVRLIGEW